METIHKIGRRKTAVARVYVSEGKGNITINQRDLADYFPTATLQYKVKQPFTLTGADGNYDVKVNVYGGGITGQAEAIRLALSRVMSENRYREQNGFEARRTLDKRPKNGGT